jgi:ribonucleoside-diphosphate reductase subunit M1
MLYVTKRNGDKQSVQFDKITERISRLIFPSELQRLDLSYLNINDEVKTLDPVLVAQKVVASLYPGITTEELDIESANICMNLSTNNPSYSYLGGRILVSNLHKKTLNDFSSKIEYLYKTNTNISKNFYEYVMENNTELNKIIDYDRDYLYDYFGYKTLEKSYLLRNIHDKAIVERPQDMILRTAITLQKGNIDMIKKTYDMISLGFYTHASPTLFNSGTNNMQLSSCFLLSTKDDLTEITKTWNSCAQISKWAGGIGLSITNIRGKNSIIKGTGGLSNGLVPFLKVFNDISRWIDQGGKRPGSIAVYLEPYHPDIFEFLDLRKNFGSETERTRDLFLALWIPDLFMQQIEIDGDWYLLSSDDCPRLPEVYGEEFNTLYWKYVNEGKYRKVVKARELWKSIMESQIETGMPYVSYKDTVNSRSNQKNLGTIKNSNLCNEIVQYSDEKEYAVCNLASISLKSFIKPKEYEYIIYTYTNCIYCTYAKRYLENKNIKYVCHEYSKETSDYLKKLLSLDEITYPQIFTKDNKHIGGFSELYKTNVGYFDYDLLYDVAYTSTINLDKVIDVNFYPVYEAKLSNMKHRSIGLGIQGMADALVLLRIPYESEEAITFNKKIMETIYLGSMTASKDLAKSRHNDMKELIDILSLEDYKITEFYDDNAVYRDNKFNILYHQLKPNKYEVEKLNNKYGTYSSYEGSLFSEGKFQFDMIPSFDQNTLYYQEKWTELKKEVAIYGTRNSMLTALMPTASTSQILGNNECFEFFTNNIYTRKTQAGDFIMVNRYMVNDLISIGLWSNEMKDKIIANDGSIQTLDNIPSEIKKIYKTMWEIKQLWVLKAAEARSPFVDQTQSMNIFMAEPDYQKLSSCHFNSWKRGLKTGMYYLRTKPSTGAIKFTIDPNLEKNLKNNDNNCESCSA